MHLVSRLLDLTVLLAFLPASHTLASSTEEAFHTVEINDTLGALLLFLNNWILLLRHARSVVTEPSLALGTWACDL